MSNYTGRLYDGISGHAHDVEAVFNTTGLDLRQASGWFEHVDRERLARADGDSAKLRLARSDVDGWRLTLPLEARDAVERLLGEPERYGRWVDRVGLIPAAIIFAAIAVGLLTIGYLAPHWVAPHVPLAWERNVGNAIVGDFGDNRCRSPDGQKALEALAERLEPGVTGGKNAIQLAALDINMFNAAALPGGYVVFFKGALRESGNPDALAGIMAHEIAHVRRRHVTEALIRELGIGALIRLFAGDVGASAQQIVGLSYTRNNEAQADADAIAMLKRAGISPRPTAALFRRLSQEAGEGGRFDAEFLQSHPLSGKRAQRFDASFDPRVAYRPALTDQQAQVLMQACEKQAANKPT
jgi:Zn-dependent protease with chaperone function